MALIVTRDPKAWAKLGKRLREDREAEGYSRKALAEKAGVSEKSIQIAEEGRVPRGRMPQSLARIERALGWLPGSHLNILAGQSWAKVTYQEVETELEPLDAGGSAESEDVPGTTGWRPTRDMELTQSGFLAQDMFVRQVKRHRKRLDLTHEELARRVSAIGGSMQPQAIAELEEGLVELKLAEADLLARALDQTVQDMLASAFNATDEALKAPPTEEELVAEAKAVERRIFDVGTKANQAAERLQQANAEVRSARERADFASQVFRQHVAMKADLESQYQYLLGRIDSLRSSRGEAEIMEIRED